MVTSKQLADMLRAVNVAEVAKASGVSTKTIYRIRQRPDEYSPTLETAGKLLDAIKASGKRKPAKVAA